MLAKHLKSIVKKFGTIAPSKQESISNKIFDVKAGKGISKTIEFAKIDKEIVSQNKSGCLMAKNSISEDAHAKFKSSTWKNNLSEKPTIKVPWFPQCESDLDLFGNMLIDLDPAKNPDHPSFCDPDYRTRREAIGKSSIGYRMQDPISSVQYSPEETAVWKYIYTRVRPLYNRLMCSEYLHSLSELEKEGLFTPERIPQLEDINQFLRKTTNWRIKPVNGILSQREFLNCLAFRTFCSTQYIRHPSQPEYTPEPDIMHEYLGHLPNFADPKICDISQRLGLLSLGASDEQITAIGAIYWYTIEFGICREAGKKKIYGAGPCGSIKELHYIEELFRSKPEVFRPLRITKGGDFPTNLVLQDLQPFYYIAESFNDFLHQLDEYASDYSRQFDVMYDSTTNSIRTSVPVSLIHPHEG